VSPHRLDTIPVSVPWLVQDRSRNTAHHASRCGLTLRQYLNGRTEGLLFPAKNGSPFRNNNVLRRQVHPLLAELGIPQGGVHGFRHGRVSFLVENNTAVEVIKAWIGHRSERMIRRYTHLRPQYRSRVLASIPSLIGNKIDVIDPLTQQAVA